MLHVKNMGPIGFKRYIQDKKVYIFGAGRALESCMDLYCGGKRVAGIIDNNSVLWGEILFHHEMPVAVFGVERLVRELRNEEEKRRSVLLISSPFYAADIVEELDRIPELDGVECFLQVLIRNTKEKIKPFEFTSGEEIIPKKIHYIWVGGKHLPYEFEANIESWKKYNPQYEIICWNEKNYDFNKCAYVREAYATQEWGFVPNYVRLDIVYRHGGIYLDTDVEVKKNFDCLLRDAAFINMGSADRINMGCGFGAVAGHRMIYDMAKAFEESHFQLKNGKPGKRPCHMFVHPVVTQYGFEIKNEYQKRNQIALYPCEVMSPLTIEGMENFISEKTLSVHKEAGAWKNPKEQAGMRKLVALIKDRLLIGGN